MTLDAFFGQVVLELHLAHRLERIPFTKPESFILSVSYMRILTYTGTQSRRDLVESTVEDRWKHIAISSGKSTQLLWSLRECSMYH